MTYPSVVTHYNMPWSPCAWWCMIFHSSPCTSKTLVAASIPTPSSRVHLLDARDEPPPVRGVHAHLLRGNVHARARGHGREDDVPTLANLVRAADARAARMEALDVVSDAPHSAHRLGVGGAKRVIEPFVGVGDARGGVAAHGDEAVAETRRLGEVLGRDGDVEEVLDVEMLGPSPEYPLGASSRFPDCATTTRRGRASARRETAREREARADDDQGGRACESGDDHIEKRGASLVWAGRASSSPLTLTVANYVR